MKEGLSNMVSIAALADYYSYLRLNLIYTHIFFGDGIKADCQIWLSESGCQIMTGFRNLNYKREAMILFISTTLLDQIKKFYSLIMNFFAQFYSQPEPLDLGQQTSLIYSSNLEAAPIGDLFDDLLIDNKHHGESTSLFAHQSNAIPPTSMAIPDLRLSDSPILSPTTLTARKSQKIANQAMLNNRLYSQQSSQYTLSGDELYDQYSVRRRKKIVKLKREQYPTKNFLPSFRSSFITFLAQYFDSGYFYSHPVVFEIQNKKCINLHDYENLFNVDEFRPYLEQYFKQRVIYRDLMSSRVVLKTKKHYFEKIGVFQKAFVSRKFTKIN